MELRQPVLTSPANPVSGLAYLHIVLIQVDQPMERDRTCTLEISQKKKQQKNKNKNYMAAVSMSKFTCTNHLYR